MRIDVNERLAGLLKDAGRDDLLGGFDVDADFYSEHAAQVAASHPQASLDDLKLLTGYSIALHANASHNRKEAAKEPLVQAPDPVPAPILASADPAPAPTQFVHWIQVLLLIALLLATCFRAKAQGTGGIILRGQQSGVTQFTRAGGLITLNCSTGLTCAFTSGVWTLTASGIPYPGAGIPCSTGSAWCTSYGVTGSGTSVVLGTAPTISTPKVDQINDTNGNAAIIVTPTASAVDQVTVANSATGTHSVGISATGSDANIDLTLTAKGSGRVKAPGGSLTVDSGSGTNTIVLRDGSITKTAGADFSIGSTSIGTNVTTTMLRSGNGSANAQYGADAGTKGHCFYSGTTNGSTLLACLTTGGHIVYTGPSAPSITSGFGTSPAIAGADGAGRLTVGTGGSATTGVVTFGTAWTTAPACVANDESTIKPVQATATTTTLTLTASAAFTASDLLTWHCTGY